MIALEIRDRPSPNHGPRGSPARIDMLVLHYTGMRSAQAAIERLCDAGARVSAHYVVEENGTIWRLVPETRRAFHAGVSCWEGESDLNAVSLGIEIVNPGHECGYRRFPDAQMASVELLCRDLISRHSIPAHRVVGHSDIAPDRKTDPGELFDWPWLARAGIGIWPPATPPEARCKIDDTRSRSDLAAIGYCTAGRSHIPTLAAFQRRFRPSCCDGRLDPETVSRLSEVRAAYERSRAASHVAVQDALQSAPVDRAVPRPEPTTPISKKAVATSSVKASCTIGRLRARR
jgi:N-acetylmuramoyl-L-alanine amidase